MRFCAVSSRAVLVFVETHGLTPDPLIVETLERILEDHCGASVVNDAEQGVWPHELWEQLEVAGLPLTWVPEECSGAGATLIDGFEVAKVAGRYAVPVPLVETLLAGWLLSKAGLKVPPGALAPVHAADFIDVQPSHTLSGVAQRVAFASKAAYLVVETSSGVGLVERDAVEIHSRVGLSGDPYDRVSFDQTPVNAWSADTDLQRSVKLMGATLRSQQIAGALERILAQSTQYAGERVAFGRPIAKFQAVQHNLAVLAGEMATAGAAASAAARVLAATVRKTTGPCWPSPQPRCGPASQPVAGLLSLIRYTALSDTPEITACSNTPGDCCPGGTILARRISGLGSWARM